MSLSEQEYLRSITRWLLRLDSWRNWVSNEEWSTPAEFSELANDDAANVWWSPPSQIVASSIGVAVDHLQAIRILVVENRQLFPFAVQTLARPALIGASQAVWILSDNDRTTRLTRANSVRAESYRRHVQWLDNQSTGNDSIRQHFVHRLENIPDTPRLILTDVINFAARMAFVRRADSEQLIKETASVWQRTGGAAHALPWAFANQPGTAAGASSRDSQLATMVVTGSIDEVATSFNCAALMLGKAWQLWFTRSANCSARDSV